MKRKEKPLTMDESVEKLAALLQPVWSKFTPEEKAERLRKTKKFISSVKRKERAKVSKSSRVRPGRRRALTGR
jgi:hypothetical protein